jgi:hypothetical protein
MYRLFWGNEGICDFIFPKKLSKKNLPQAPANLSAALEETNRFLYF